MSEASTEELAIALASPSQTGVTNATGPSPDILTPVPIETRCREFDRVAVLGEHFRFIDTNIGIFLEGDSHATTVREYLVAFNTPMFDVDELIEQGLSQARTSYTHNDDEYAGEDLDLEITDARAQILLDKNFQDQVVKHAKFAAARFESAAKLLKEDALPRFPRLRHEIHEYVREYGVRYQEMCWRKKIWLPNSWLNFIMGPNDPVPIEFSKIQGMSKDIDVVGGLLEGLHSFLDTMASHFLQLSELSPNDIASLGYSKPEDLRRLYRDRLLCSQLLLKMDIMNTPMNRAFMTGKRGLFGTQA